MVKLVKKPSRKMQRKAREWLDEKPGEREKREREEREQRLERMRFLREPLTHSPFACLAGVE